MIFAAVPMRLYKAVLTYKLYHFVPKTVVLVSTQFLCQNKPKSDYYTGKLLVKYLHIKSRVQEGLTLQHHFYIN